jgi:hypothetical protein
MKMLYVLKVLVVTLCFLGCSSENTVTPDSLPDTSTNRIDNDVSVPGPDTETDTITERCDNLDPSRCVLPWPSNKFLKYDPLRVTGYSLAFGNDTLPQNKDQKHMDGTALQRMDGYSVGTSILAHFPNADLSAAANERNLAPSLETDHISLLIEVQADGTFELVPHWLEMDRRASKQEDQVLFLRPGAVLKPATRYIVVFQNLRDMLFTKFPRSEGMQAFFDREGDERQPLFDDIFVKLTNFGVKLEDVQLTWDFLTASHDALHGSLVNMRDDALNAVSTSGPTLNISEIQEYSIEDDEFIWLDIKGTFDVPNFMKAVELPGSTAYVFNKDTTGNITQNGWSTEDFWIRIPQSARNGTPQAIVNYGHGQTGRGDQIKAGHNRRLMYEHNFIYYGCDMLGMSEEDVANIILLCSDLSDFAWVADRLHQGMVNHILLQLAMESQLPYLADITNRSIKVNADEHYYSGISQGGIFGPTVVALSPYITRGHLGVPGTNFARLLSRSKNFDQFYAILNGSYPSIMDQALALEAAHTIWAQTDSVSWYRRLKAEPLTNGVSNEVLLTPAKGDPQVAVLTTETLARTKELQISVMENYDSTREVSLADETPYPHAGSGIVLYDFGNPWPPIGNISPDKFPEHEPGPDPHGKARSTAYHNLQLAHFLREGVIIDVCNGNGCTPD